MRTVLLSNTRSLTPVAARIVSVKRHPHADKLLVLGLDAGDRRIRPAVIEFMEDEKLDAGDLVLAILPGERMPSGEKLRARQFRGIRSEARLLSFGQLDMPAAEPDFIVRLNDNEAVVGERVDIDSLA